MGRAGVLISGLPADIDPPDLEPVPTLADLHRDGLALAVGWGADGRPTHFTPSREGHARLGAVMRRNADRCKAWRERGTR